ncbi:MAG: RNA polymerase sigma factor [Tahibacter sp.]
MHVSDQLLLAAQAGERDALTRLITQLKPDIHRYARRQCHRGSAIEDVVQEALIVLYRRIGSVRSPAAILGWLSTVVARLCMLPALGLMRLTEAISDVDDAQRLARCSSEDLRIDLVRAIESLSPPHRQVVLLRDMEDLTIAEIAERIGNTREAVKSRLHRARVLLREYLIGDTPQP